eukprot:TRINITY_DN76155_c0_g1_i1.p1 TRINITY_DN76155_c0_g1~~TRINITY_DN76155_c0_g1_i1.p1  ORF type:complete len:258 (+),score=40.03 TRINITY_DN76155_c0_g1_i1:62-835(+)
MSPTAGELEGLLACAPKVRETLPFAVHCQAVADGTEIPDGAKKIHFIRHGEGFHNVAQKEWRANPEWDGKSEPYTADNDPTGRYTDALLTDEGERQARELQERTANLQPELLIVSPMRRATQTGLIAFEQHVAAAKLPTMAQELCHERAGAHTCDKRLSRTELKALFPAVDYSLLESEDDPYWGDGVTRESPFALAGRGARFVEWLMARPERHIAVAAHSAWLLGMMNAVLECNDDATRTFFATGEMRTVLLSPDKK